MKRVWVDFNTRDEAGLHFTLLEQAKRTHEGERVVLYDDEGTELPGVVVRLDYGEGLAYVRVDQEDDARQGGTSRSVRA